MPHYSTQSHHLEREIFTFSEKLTKDFSKPVQKFICLMIFGLIASKSSHLTKIARKLNEKITLKKTVERLSRNLMTFSGRRELHEHYISAVSHYFDERAIFIFDDSNINKNCSSKLESLCTVRDGSTGEMVTDYWCAGMTALSVKKQQLIPVVGSVYSSAESGYLSNNKETIKSLEYASQNFSKDIIRTFDRGYDDIFLV